MSPGPEGGSGAASPRAGWKEPSALAPLEQAARLWIGHARG